MTTTPLTVGGIGIDHSGKDVSGNRNFSEREYKVLVINGIDTVGYGVMGKPQGGDTIKVQYSDNSEIQRYPLQSKQEQYDSILAEHARLAPKARVPRFVPVTVPATIPAQPTRAVDLSNKQFELLMGDCLEEMRKIPTHSVDVLVCGLPYETTGLVWDSLKTFDFPQMWVEACRVVKPGGAMCFMCDTGLGVRLIESNWDRFKYMFTWVKPQGTNPMGVRTRPSFYKFEQFAIFHEVLPNGSDEYLTYNPIMYEGEPYEAHDNTKGKTTGASQGKLHSFHRESDGSRYPTDILYGPQDRRPIVVDPVSGIPNKHDTPNPLWIFEYMIRTFSNEGDTVLDITMGGGGTGVAAINCGRKFIGIEMDPEIFNFAKDSVEKATKGGNKEFEEAAAETNNFSAPRMLLGEIERLEIENENLRSRLEGAEEAEAEADLKSLLTAATCTS